MQGNIWILTIPHHEFTPYLPDSIRYLKGQLELGAGGFLHWQVICYFKRSTRLAAVRNIFGPFHAELSRSAAADDYVWKDDTRVAGTQFELGDKPLKRNNKRDWEQIKQLALAGDLLEIDSSVFVQHYRSLRSIAADYARPVPIVRQVHVFWGKTGTGKSRRAWDEAGMDAYSKDPRSKFWCGYRGDRHVVVDEFRGGIDISHILRWTDRYPCHIELKGSSAPFMATTIWITSNLDPREWYPGLDDETLAALLRRLTIVHFDAL